MLSHILTTTFITYALTIRDVEVSTWSGLQCLASMSTVTSDMLLNMSHEVLVEEPIFEEPISSMDSVERWKLWLDPRESTLFEWLISLLIRFEFDAEYFRFDSVSAFSSEL